MDEILEGNYKMNEFPIGSVIESYSPYHWNRLVVGFRTTEYGIGVYELDFIDDLGTAIKRFEFTQEYVESEYHLKEGEGDEN